VEEHGNGGEGGKAVVAKKCRKIAPGRGKNERAMKKRGAVKKVVDDCVE